MADTCLAFFDGSRWVPAVEKGENPEDFDLVGLASIEDLRKSGLPEDTKSVMLAKKRNGKHYQC